MEMKVIFLVISSLHDYTCIYFTFLSVVDVSFTKSVYEVSEVETIVNICAVLMGEIAREVRVYLTTIEGTALNGSDYINILKEERVFQPSTAPDDLGVCWNITLQDDDVLEANETFSVTLIKNDTDVSLNGGTATVIVVDDDSKYTI